MPTRNLTTKDDVPLRELLDTAERIVDVFNDVADFPFRDLFVENVPQQHFTQLPDGEYKWEELAEGEHPRTAEYDDQKRVPLSVAKYGRSLGFTQEFIEDNDSQQVEKRFRRLVEGAQELMQDHILDVIDSGIPDGTQDAWYTVEDYGNYSFSDDHQHRFSSTDDLFGDGNSHEAHEHIEQLADHLRHHGRGENLVGLTSASFKRSLRDEITWDAQYNIPMASNLRTTNINDATINIDGVSLLQTPWVTGDEIYVVDAASDKPVKMHEKRPVQLTRPNGGAVQQPGELLGASGTGRWGFKMADPLGAAYINADDLK